MYSINMQHADIVELQDESNIPTEYKLVESVISIVADLHISRSRYHQGRVGVSQNLGLQAIHAYFVFEAVISAHRSLTRDY